MQQSLNEQIMADMKEAMRSGDTFRRDVIRYLRSAVRNREIEVQHSLSDSEIHSVVQRQIKQRQDSAEAYRDGGRDDLAEAEEREIAVLGPYMPAQMSEDELRDLVSRTASDLSLSGPADMKTLMPALMKETAGQADGRTLSRLASQELKRRAEESSS